MRHLQTYENWFKDTIDKVKYKLNDKSGPKHAWDDDEMECLINIGFIQTKPNDTDIVIINFNDGIYNFRIEKISTTEFASVLSEYQQKQIGDFFCKYTDFSQKIPSIKNFSTLTKTLKHIFKKKFQEYYLDNYGQYALELKNYNLLDKDIEEKYKYLFDSEELGLL